MNELISCTYKVGRSSTFKSSWYGNNLFLSDSKLYFIEDGEIVVEINDEKILAKKGDLLLIPAETLHSCSLSEKMYMKKSWCHFSMKRGNLEFFQDYRFPFRIHVTEEEYVSSLFNELFSSHHLSSPCKELISSSAILKIVSYYLSHCTIVNKQETDDEISKAIHYIKNNYSLHISLDTLAQNASYSLNHFTKKFKEKTGYTPIQYINLIKINTAKNLLQYSDAPISEIMEKVGFLDSAYFSKIFKKTVGYSPSDFRALYRKKIK